MQRKTKGISYNEFNLRKFTHRLNVLYVDSREINLCSPQAAAIDRRMMDYRITEWKPHPLQNISVQNLGQYI